MVIAQYRTLPGRAEEVAEVLARHAVASRAEPGCIDFEACRSAEDGDRFVLLERYRDEAAFQAHRDSQHFRDNIEAVVATLLAERSWQRYQPVPPGG